MLPLVYGFAYTVKNGVYIYPNLGCIMIPPVEGPMGCNMIFH